MLAVISESGFKITIGRADLSKASDITGGVCMTSFFDDAMTTGSQVWIYAQ